MSRPGTTITVVSSPPPRSQPTDTSVWFVVGLADQGRTDIPTLIRSIDDFNSLMGGRVSYSSLYDCIETFFREGGSTAYVGRVVGPAAAVASKNLLDGSAAISLVAKAKSPGLWANTWKIAVVAPFVSGYRIQITDPNNVIQEDSGDLADQPSAVAWSAYSKYVNITLGVSTNNPALVAAAVFTGGADDRVNIVDSNWLTALNTFTKDLGPGQVSAPGRTTDVGHTQLCDHAAANNRVALLDSPDTATQATILTSAGNAKTTAHGNYGAFFWPWVVVPGLVAGTTRTVPPSAAVAGAIARTDLSDGPDTPAAGDKGLLQFGIDLSQAGIDDTTRQTANASGVNVIRNMYGDQRIYGWRSLADPVQAAQWLNFGAVRLIMAIVGQAAVIGEQFVFDTIDGQGHTIQAYASALTGMLQTFYNAGQLYGASPSDAFNVNVGPQVNTPTTLANNELHAVIAVRPSPFAELVYITIVNVPITQTVS
jgi:hypothetical protein